LLCDNNSLTALDVSNNPELLYLGCGNNKLTALDVSQNTKLTGFTCGNNPISHLKISGGYELTVNINPAASGSVMLTDYTHFTKSCTFSAAPGGANTFSGWTYSGFSKNPSASSNPVSFNLPASAVTVTANFAPPVKTVSVGAQTGALTAGSAGSATFAVTTANIADGTYPVTLNGAPTGVTAGSIDISGNRGTLTLSTTAATPQNRHPVTITIGGTTSGSFDLVVSAPGVVSVSGITVSGLGGARAITTNGGTLQMLAAVSPANATNAAVTWSVIPGTGSATIGSTGLLTATGNGTVWVRATAQDGSGVQAQLEVTISGQTVPPTQYPLIVTKGTGGGNYASGVVITITANAAPSGQVFDKWTSVGGGKFANANSATTTFTMPANAATVTATYKASGGPGPVYTDASMTPSSAVYDKYDSSANHKSVPHPVWRHGAGFGHRLYGERQPVYIPERIS
jgi:hypothetical protein